MASFDVKSLIHKISLTETNGLCVESLSNQTHIDNLSKSYFYRLLEMTMYEFILFNQKYYKQCDGVAMDFALGNPLTNVFMCHVKETCL